METGSTQSLIGHSQFHAYCKQYNLSIKTRPSPHYFRFGTGVHQSRGTFKARIPLPNQSYLNLKTSIAPIEVPFLIGLDVLLENAITTNFHKNAMQGKDIAWELPTYYKSGNAFKIPSPSPLRCCFTRNELIKHHKQLMHPSDCKLFTLLNHAYPSEISEKIRQILQKMAENGEPCSEQPVPPVRFRASIPRDEIIFNREFSIDLIWLKEKPVLHIVDTKTGFQNSIFTKDK